MSVEALAFIERDLNLMLNQIAEAGKDVKLEAVPPALEVLLRKVRKHLKEERKVRNEFSLSNASRLQLISRIENQRQEIRNLQECNERGVQEAVRLHAHFRTLKKVVKELP
jgi:hypothetical protein